MPWARSRHEYRSTIRIRVGYCTGNHISHTNANSLLLQTTAFYLYIRIRQQVLRNVHQFLELASSWSIFGVVYWRHSLARV